MASSLSTSILRRATTRTVSPRWRRFPDTLEAESPSGSIHYLFRHPGFPVKNSESKLAPGIDVRGDGGMVLAAPSVKPGKGAYKWRNPDVPIADAPEWLLGKIKTHVADRSTLTGPVPDAVGGVSHDA